MRSLSHSLSSPLSHSLSLLRSTRLYYTQALSVELLYRFPLFQSFLSVAIGFIGVGFFWTAAGRSAAGHSSYTPGLLLAYFLISSAHSILHENHLAASLSLAIRMGKLSASMLRPYPFLLSVIAQAASHATVRFCFLLPIVAAMMLGLDLFSEVLAQLTPLHLLIYAAALALSLIAGWVAKIALGLLAFDMTQTWGPELIFLSFFALASGVAYPVDLLPPTLLTIATWTPVYYMIGFPTLVFLGHIAPAEIILGLERGLLVSLLTALAVFLLWRRGMGRFEAVGI